MISKDEVKKLAELSLLAVEESELDTLTGEIDAILGYVSVIDELASKEDDTKKKPELYNVLRDDEITNSKGEYSEKILQEAPQTEGKYLRVKKIL